MFEQRFSMFFYEKLVVKFLVPYWSGTCTGLKLIKVSLPITEQNPKTVFLGGKQRTYTLLGCPTPDRYTVREMRFTAK